MPKRQPGERRCRKIHGQSLERSVPLGDAQSVEPDVKLTHVLSSLQSAGTNTCVAVMIEKAGKALSYRGVRLALRGNAIATCASGYLASW